MYAAAVALHELRSDHVVLPIIGTFHEYIRADRAMKAGLDAFYRTRDAKRAVVEFRAVLASRPTHYGATFQLGKALDAAGDTVKATMVWRRTLRLAETIKDTTSARIARARLGLPPRHP